MGEEQFTEEEVVEALEKWQRIVGVIITWCIEPWESGDHWSVTTVYDGGGMYETTAPTIEEAKEQAELIRLFAIEADNMGKEE